MEIQLPQTLMDFKCCNVNRNYSYFKNTNKTINFNSYNQLVYIILKMEIRSDPHNDYSHHQILISHTQPTLSIEGLFSDVKMGSPDFILESRVLYNKDPARQKINLGVGIYMDENQRPYTFEVVRKAEKDLFQQFQHHAYLETGGLLQFVQGARKLLLGETKAVISGRVASIQTIAGCGAVNIGFSLLALYLPNRQIYIPNQTWPLHKDIAQGKGIKWGEYPYYNQRTKSFDCSAMISFLETVDPGSVIVLQACAHNPTGADPNEEQWKNIASVMKKNGLIPFFDVAYQGFASGDLDKDAWAVRYFQTEGFQMFVAQSFSKNMGLYGERVGALHVVLNDKIKTEKVLSQLQIMNRKMCVSPCKYGATIAAKILNSPLLYEEWKRELKQVVVNRIFEMRLALRSELERIGAPGAWNHITEQAGMFSFTGLSEKACTILIKKYHIHLLSTGRVNIAGITPKNVGYLAYSIKKTLQELQEND